jgi:hypothetical protein
LLLFRCDLTEAWSLVRSLPKCTMLSSGQHHAEATLAETDAETPQWSCSTTWSLGSSASHASPTIGAHRSRFSAATHDDHGHAPSDPATQGGVTPTAPRSAYGRRGGGSTPTTERASSPAYGHAWCRATAFRRGPADWSAGATLAPRVRVQPPQGIGPGHIIPDDPEHVEQEQGG